MSNSSQDYIDFTYKYPTTYHVVEYFSKRLDSAGFKYLDERKDWDVLNAGKYYTIRNGTCLAAFTLGEKWEPEQGIGAIAAHIDALSVKLKPVSKKNDSEGYQVLGVAPYSGTMGSDWFDRDLGLGGKILVRNGASIESKLIDSTPHPVARISSLAPHFGQASVGPYDKETQALPVVGYRGPDDTVKDATEEEKQCPLYGRHSIDLLRYVAKLAGIAVKDLVQMDLDLYDIQKGTIGGLNSEFLFAPRLDDRICSYAAIEALINAAEAPASHFNIVLLYDNEEIGSNTRQGAQGTFFPAIVERVLRRYSPYPEGTHRAFANSVILSTDVAHLFNPGFASAYLEEHRPKPNTGITIKIDTNGHYATDLIGTTLLEEVAAKNGDKLQYFHVKNNARCGSTVGPYLAAQTGARTIDIGIPQLSMHRMREATGANDLDLAIQFMTGFFKQWNATYSTIKEA